LRLKDRYGRTLLRPGRLFETDLNPTQALLDGDIHKLNQALRINPIGLFPKLTTEVGRGGGIRTPDPLVPNQMRYQTALRPDSSSLSHHFAMIYYFANSRCASVPTVLST
jgi:hypothetical protein